MLESWRRGNQCRAAQEGADVETAALALSLIALAVSIAVAYVNALRPFSLEVFSGSPRLEPFKTETAGVPTPPPTILLPLLLANKGARGGIVYDLFLEVTTPMGTYGYYPLIVTERSLSQHRPIFGSQMLQKDSGSTPFSPVYLAGKEMLRLSVGFVPNVDHPNFSSQLGDMKPGRWVIKILATLKSDGDYKQFRSFPLELSQTHVDNLVRGDRSVLFPADVVEGRKKIEPS